MSGVAKKPKTEVALVASRVTVVIIIIIILTQSPLSFSINRERTDEGCGKAMTTTTITTKEGLQYGNTAEKHVAPQKYLPLAQRYTKRIDRLMR